VLLVLLLTRIGAVRVYGQAPAVGTAVGGASLSGIVREIDGSPLAGVSVTMLGETTATRSDSAGRFTLRDVSVGSHTTMFRRIGYRSVEHRWIARPDAAVQVAVTMPPTPVQLDRVVIEAPGSSRRRGTSSIGGTVLDGIGSPVGGADVRLLGAGLSTVTDSLGRFEFRLLAAGSYIVRARRRGLMGANYILQIVDDDNRGITLKMYGLRSGTNPHDSATASGYGVADLGFDAFDRRRRADAALLDVGPGDLFRADRAPLDIVLGRFRGDSPALGRRAAPVSDDARSSEDGDCLLINGRRAAYQPLGSFNSLDVLLVEVFRANAFADESVVTQMDAVRECRGTMDRHPSYFVLWMRSVR
jgi:hypothetical protein